MALKQMWNLMGPSSLLLNPLIIAALGFLATDNFGRGLFSVVLAILVGGAQPDGKKYQTFSVPAQTWRKHSSILATAYMVIGGLTYFAHETWWPYILPVIAWVWRIVHDARDKGPIPEPAEKRLRANSPGRDDFGRWAPTPRAQLVLAPLVRSWSGTWLAVIVIGALTLVPDGLFSDRVTDIIETIGAAGMLIILAAVFIVFVFGEEHVGSLRNYVTMGGNRKDWTKTAVLAPLAGVAMTTVAMLLYAVITGLWPWWLVMASLLFPATMISLEMANKKTWFVAVVMIAVAIALLILHNRVNSQSLLTLGAAGVYLLWVPAVAWQVRLKEPFKPGISAWFGTD
ncbi:hypothetical protein [Corynebacterium camporealensis]